MCSRSFSRSVCFSLFVCVGAAIGSGSCVFGRAVWGDRMTTLFISEQWTPTKKRRRDTRLETTPSPQVSESVSKGGGVGGGQTVSFGRNNSPCIHVQTHCTLYSTLRCNIGVGCPAFAHIPIHAMFFVPGGMQTRERGPDYIKVRATCRFCFATSRLLALIPARPSNKCPNCFHIFGKVLTTILPCPTRTTHPGLCVCGRARARGEYRGFNTGPGALSRVVFRTAPCHIWVWCIERKCVRRCWCLRCEY